MRKGALLLLISFFLIGCRAETAETADTTTTETAVTSTPTTSTSLTPSPHHPITPSPHHPATPSPPPPPTLTPIPTAADTATATATPTASPTATAVACADRLPPPDDLLPIVTLDYGLSRDYKPANLVDLNDYLPHRVTLGYPTELRRAAVGPLVEMIGDMEAAGLQPQVISGYRSYAAQAIAWAKWNESHPDTAAIVSAPPGHSEHQLGTTVDFGSPELPEIVGEEDIQFHTYFYKTSEGEWLLEHAHEYGFTLSYSREAFELTGLYYEPWHYRYVGRELATHLHDAGTTLTAYLLEQNPNPCLP